MKDNIQIIDNGLTHPLWHILLWITDTMADTSLAVQIENQKIEKMIAVFKALNTSSPKYSRFFLMS